MIRQLCMLKKSSPVVLFLFSFTLSVLLLPVTGFSLQGKDGASPSGPAGAPGTALINVNRVSMWANSDGVLEYNGVSEQPGVIYPYGTTSVVSRGGLLWGGYVWDGASPVLRSGGQSQVSGTAPGRIIRPGVYENPSSGDVRIFRIRPDWATADLRRDAAETFRVPEVLVTDADIANLREQYRRDWIEWPWEKGAPFYERNGEPGYQPGPAAERDTLYDEPGLAGADQVIWFVVNDLDTLAPRSLYGSPGPGLETQITCWAYDREGGLDHVVFQRYRLIYKGDTHTPSGASIDPIYVGKWVDADIGNFADDYAGYDPDAELMYAYNAEPKDLEFDKIPAVPSVVGYALLQGPRKPQGGGEAYWDLGRIPGYVNVPAASFTYFNGDTRASDLDVGRYTGTREIWNSLRGFHGAPADEANCFVDPITGECTKFELTGDPVTFSGWVDGKWDPPGDRRLLLSTGAFSLARGDTQEVLFALVGGTGSDNRDGVRDLRENYAAARDLFLTNFNAPLSVPLPSVRPIELDRKIILDWESDAGALAAVEEYDSRGFRFENYEIYQLPHAGSDLGEGVQLPAFDVTKPRFLSITHDLLRDRALVNGQHYYYAFRTRAFNPDDAFVNPRIHSRPVVLDIVPHAPNPGVVYPYPTGTILSDAENLLGNNEAVVKVSYHDPTKPDGHVYKLTFHRSPIQIIDLANKPTWDLIDSTSGDTLLSGIKMDTSARRVVSRGFSVECISPLYGIRGVYQTEYGGGEDTSMVFNKPNPAGEYMVVGAGSSYLDTILGGNPLDVDVELRFEGDSSWALMLGPTVPTSRWVRVPFTAWQNGVIGRDTIHRQIYTVVSESGSDSVWRSAVLLNREYDGQTLRVFYPLTIVSDSQKLGEGSIAGVYKDDIPYDPVEGPPVKGFLWVSGKTFNTKSAIWKVYIADLDDDGIAAPAGTVIRFERYKYVRDGDEKIFRYLPVATDDLDAAREEIARVNVFPNPYYGFNAAEVNRFEHFVTFSHLPRVAVIRIFNLAGDLVRTIEKDDESQFARWDLNNHNGLPVGGGLYLATVNMSDGSGYDLGSATLKLMIVPEKQSIELR